MVKFAAVKKAFSGGEISPFLHGRSDLEIYAGAVKRSKNWIVDGFGSLHRRPGTKFVAKSKGKPCFYKFDAGDDCNISIAATAGCFQFLIDGALSGDDFDVPYGEDEYCDLKTANDCGALFITHPAHPPRLLTKTEDGFALSEFPSLPYADLNDDETCRVCLSAGGTSTSGNMTVASDELALGDTVDVIDFTGATLGTVTLTGSLGANTFEGPYVAGIPSGQYVDQNGTPIFVQSSGAILEAQGCEPFTPEMVGRLIRVLDENGSCQSIGTSEELQYEFVGSDPDTGALLGDWEYLSGNYVEVGAGNGSYEQTTDTQEVEQDANEPNTWLSLQIIGYTSPTEIEVAYSGCELKCTDLYCLPNFVDGEYPSSVWIHQDRLWFAKDNCFWASRTGNFFDWEKSQADGSVNPDNAIYGKIDAGECHEIQWMRTNGRFLTLGTDRGIYALGGSNGGVAADDLGQQLIQSVGAASIDPISVGEGTLFVDRTCRNIYAVQPGIQYEQLELTRLTRFVDHIGVRRFADMWFQEEPFSLLWAVTEDGCLFSMTHEPAQGVRAWMPHELGGDLIEQGCCVKPRVCSVDGQRSNDGKRDFTYFGVERTVNGEDVTFIERIGEFREHSARIEDAEYLDAHVDLGEIGGVPPVADWQTPTVALPAQSGRVAVCDADRWFYGESDGETVTFDAPNTMRARHGRTLVDVDGEWVPVSKAKPGEKPEFVGPECCLYDPPCVPTGLVICQDEWLGFECFEGECLKVFLDGRDCGYFDVSGGQIEAQGCIGRAGYPYVSEVETLPWYANLGVSDGSGDNSAVSRVSVDVYRTPELFAVADAPDNYAQTWETCGSLIPGPDFIGVSERTGWYEVLLNGTHGVNDGGGFVLRADGPYPATVRALKVIYDASVRL